MSAGGYTRDYDTSSPLDHSKFKDQPGHVRSTKEDIAERLASFMYGFTSGETTKGLKFLEFVTQATAPTQAADSFMLYAKDVSGKAELHGKDEDANVIQITAGGKLNAAAISALSGIPSTAGDLPLANLGNAVKNTGNETVNGIKTFASFPVGPSTAPTTDYEFANKKYADDGIAVVAAKVGFGAWASKSNNTVYLADTDGFVWGEQTSGDIQMYGYSDASNPPTTLRDYDNTQNNERAHATIFFPVIKGQYWKVVGCSTVTWMPIGT